jgi:hypothetical protein
MSQERIAGWKSKLVPFQLDFFQSIAVTDDFEHRLHSSAIMLERSTYETTMGEKVDKQLTGVP